MSAFLQNHSQITPGPRNGLTGWRHLRAMSGDVLATIEAWQRAHGSVIHLRIWPERLVVVADAAVTRELLVRHHEHLVRWERAVGVFGRLSKDALLATEGEAWSRKRRALQQAFSPAAVQALGPQITDAAAQALNAWPGQHANFGIERAFTSLTMDVILRMIFSVRVTDEARAAEDAIHTLLTEANEAMYWPASWPDWVPWKMRVRRAKQRMRALIAGHITQRLNVPRVRWPQDLLTRLLSLHEAEPQTWPIDAIHDECLSLFIAGHETVAASLTWWAWNMAAHPDAQARARAEVAQALAGRVPTLADLAALPWLQQTIKETLRLYPAAPILMSRRSTQGIQVGRWHFAKGTLFTLPLLRVHHDAQHFPEPLAFKPERFAVGAPELPRGAYMPFGAGPRVCLGQHLALSELGLIAAMVLQRFALQASPGGAPPVAKLHISLRPSLPLGLSIVAI